VPIAGFPFQYFSWSLKYAFSHRLTPALGREKKKILGIVGLAKPPNNTPTRYFGKAVAKCR
jgi:hypothetical protein